VTLVFPLGVYLSSISPRSRLPRHTHSLSRRRPTHTRARLVFAMDAKANGKERKHHKRHHKASTSSHEAPEHRHSRRSVAGLMNALRPRDRLAKSQSETSASVVTDILPNPALPRTMSTSPRSMSSAASAAMALPSETDSDSIDIPTVATERAALPDDAVICAIASTGSTSDLVSVDPPTTSTTSTSTSTSSTSTSSSSSYCASLTTVFPVPVVPLRDFQVIRLIGCGAVGTVFLVQLRGTDILFAMKVITKNRVRHSRKVSTPRSLSRVRVWLYTDPPQSPRKRRLILSLVQSIDSVLAERKFLATQPGHPFINKLFYACHTALHLILVLEYCSAGDLLAAIKRQPSSRFSGIIRVSLAFPLSRKRTPRVLILGSCSCSCIAYSLACSIRGTSTSVYRRDCYGARVYSLQRLLVSRYAEI